MTARLKKISVLSLGRVMCGLHATLGFLMGLFVTVMALAGNAGASAAVFGVWSVLVLPLIYAVMGFILGSCLAAAYNLFSSLFGGVEYEIEQV